MQNIEAQFEVCQVPQAHTQGKVGTLFISLISGPFMRPYISGMRQDRDVWLSELVIWVMDRGKTQEQVAHRKIHHITMLSKLRNL